MKTREIIFKTPSELSDALCPDGEIADGARFFPIIDTTSSSSSGNPAASSSTAILRLGETECVANPLPAGVQILILHRYTQPSSLPPSLQFNIIYRLSDGSAAFSQSANPSAGITRFSDKGLIPASFNAHRHIACLDDYLIFSLPDGVYYSLYHDDSYTHPLPLPPTLSPEFAALQASLPGYSSTTDNLPQIILTLKVESAIASAVSAWLDGSPDQYDSLTSEDRKKFDTLNSSIESALKAGVAEYMDAAEKASLFLFPIVVKTAVTLQDGTQIISSPLAKIHPEGDFSLLVASHSISEGVLRLTVDINRHPFIPECKFSDVSLPDFLQNAAMGIDFEVSHPLKDVEFSSLSPLSSIYMKNGKRSRGWRPTPVSPVNVNEEGCKTTLYRRYIPEFRDCFASSQICPPLLAGIPSVRSINSRLIFFNGNRIVASVPGNPFVLTGTSLIEGGELLDIAPSFRSISSGQLGEFPLYAFSEDGIRALTPDTGGGFRTAQLISRHVAFPDSVTPVVSSVAFLSKQGLMNLEGTAVNLISTVEEITSFISTTFSSTLLLAYHYGGDAIVVWNSAGGRCGVYNLGRKRWEEGSGIYSNGLYTLWPALYTLTTGRTLCQLEAGYEIEEGSGDMCRIGGVKDEWVMTRPMKLGSIVSRKRVYGYEIAPPGMLFASSLEGSDDLVNWRVLLQASGGAASRACGLRTRPWRYYRLSLRLNSSALPSSVLIYGEAAS